MAAPARAELGAFSRARIGVVPRQERRAERRLCEVTVELPTIVDGVSLFAAGADEPILRPVATLISVAADAKERRWRFHVGERAHQSVLLFPEITPRMMIASITV